MQIVARAPDALHLAVIATAGPEVATADAEMARAAEALGVRVTIRGPGEDERRSRAPA